LGLQASTAVDWKAPCVLYTGEFGGSKVSVVINGKDKRYGVDNVRYFKYI